MSKPQIASHNRIRFTEGHPAPTALAKAAPAELQSPGDFGDEHRRIVKDFFAPGATDLEFAILWAGAKSRGLDPVRKQIHFVSRNQKEKGEGNVERWVKKWASQVAIDGFRSIAEATGKYDGQDEPEYETSESGGVLVARVRVYRKDISRPFVGVAMWLEFVQLYEGKPTSMWAKMPFHMLSKCAEAQAFRKAFPEQLGGLYTSEEMPPEEPRAIVAHAEPASAPPADTTPKARETGEEG